MRWSLRQSDFEFMVEHDPGSKIAHVDALSLYVGTVGDGQEISKPEMLREQEQDPFCIRQKEFGFTKRSEFFFLDSVEFSTSTSRARYFNWWYRRLAYRR
jgi:hypothetical protein